MNYEVSQLTTIERQLKEALLFSQLSQAAGLIDQGADLNKHYFMIASTPLYYGAAHNYVAQVRLLLQYSERINLDVINAVTGDTALHAACWNGCAENIFLLLQFGANANILAQQTGYLPLHLYIYQDNNRVERPVLRRLIEATTDLNSVMRRDGADGPAGVSAVHLATTQDNAVEILEELNRSGQSLAINTLDLQGHTPLHHAVWQEHEGAVDWLLAHGAQPNIASAQRPYNDESYHNSQWTPLHYAARKKNLRMCYLLLHAGADPNCKTQTGLTARDMYVLQITRQIESLNTHPVSDELELLQQRKKVELQEFDETVHRAQPKERCLKR